MALSRRTRRAVGPYCDGLCLLSARTRAATSEAVKPLGEEDKASSASMTRRMRALLRSMPPTMVLPTRDAAGSCSSISSAMKHWSMQLRASANLSRTLFNRETTSGNLSSERPQLSSSRVMGNDLDAKDAFAFGIDLQSQLAAVQLEDRQIIRRSLNRDFPFGRALCWPAIFRTMLVSEDGFDGLEIEWRTASVDERLKHLFHMTAFLTEQVATVSDLI